MAKALSFEPIGFLESPFETKNGTPRQPQLVGSATSRLKIRHERLPHPEHALDGITGYSHVWIVFYFHKDASAERLGEPIKSKVTPPKSGGIKCGLFSTRTPQRPNAIGLSLFMGNVEIHLPSNYKINISVGQRCLARETIVANII